MGDYHKSMSVWFLNMLDEQGWTKDTCDSEILCQIFSTRSNHKTNANTFLLLLLFLVRVNVTL